MSRETIKNTFEYWLNNTDGVLICFNEIGLHKLSRDYCFNLVVASGVVGYDQLVRKINKDLTNLNSY